MFLENYIQKNMQEKKMEKKEKKKTIWNYFVRFTIHWLKYFDYI